MKEDKIIEIKKILAYELEKYKNIFKQEFLEFIPRDILIFFDEYSSYEDLIKIEETGTISCFVRNNIIYLPLLADMILKNMSFSSDFGSCPNHKTYTVDTLIINNNTFLDYINHSRLAGISLLDFYEDMLLHEAMHLCGMDGANAFLEGITELKTRELAKKYNLKTNACGYPKEVKIIYRLQEIFGSTLINKISFRMSWRERFLIIEDMVGKDGSKLFEEIFRLMEEEFYNKYYRYVYSGADAHIEKFKRYDEIDYTCIYRLIEEYCINHDII